MERKELPLHLKYRPESFKEVYGNTVILKTLENKVKEKLIKTYLFYGERGTGKTTVARIIAKLLGAKSNIDIHEMNIADVGLKDKARDIIEKSSFSSFSGGAKVYIFDECQEASKGFWQAMLKTLEEPFKNVYFILCTTDPEKLPIAIKSRCASFKFAALSIKLAIKFLNDILNNEFENGHNFNNEILELIAKKTDCIPREMLILLDKVIDIEDEQEIKQIIKEHIINIEDSIELKTLIQYLMNEKKCNWKDIRELLFKLKEQESESIRYAILGYLSSVFINTTDKDRAKYVYFLMSNFKDSYFYTKKAGLYMSIAECLLFDQE